MKKSMSSVILLFLAFLLCCSSHFFDAVSFSPEKGINNRIRSIIEADDGNYVFTGYKNAPERTGVLLVTKVAP